MARRNPSILKQGISLLGNTLYRSAKYLYRSTNTHGGRLARWVATDHYGLAHRLGSMPTSGFVETIRYALLLVLIWLIGIIVNALWLYILVAYGIPYFIFGQL